MSPAAQNLAIEAFLGLMVLLLAVSLAAIARTPQTAGTTAVSSTDDGASNAPARPREWPGRNETAAAGSGSGAAAMPVSLPPAQAQSRPALAGNRPAQVSAQPAQASARRGGRYVPRHGRGYVPQQREEGPPWGPADTPPTAPRP